MARARCWIAPALLRKLVEQLGIQALLELLNALLGAQDEGLFLLELWRDIALGIDQRLLANIVRRHRLAVGVSPSR